MGLREAAILKSRPCLNALGEGEKEKEDAITDLLKAVYDGLDLQDRMALNRAIAPPDQK